MFYTSFTIFVSWSGNDVVGVCSRSIVRRADVKSASWGFVRSHLVLSCDLRGLPQTATASMILDSFVSAKLTTQQLFSKQNKKRHRRVPPPQSD